MENKIILDKEIFVMGKDPMPNITVEEVKEWYKNNNSEKDLAYIYAITHNKAWWEEDNEYDYEENSEEYKKAIRITDEWMNIADEFKEKIFELLRNEGIMIPQQGQIKILAPFMKKYGYIDSDGWWIKELKVL